MVLDSRLFPEGKIAEASRYSALSGGKRLRPQLLLAVAEAYGARLENALTPACALELVHTYSLIHDDLPCMDDDDMRRGKPSLHKVYPEGHALLTGDFLLTYAFQLLAESPNLSPNQQIALVRTLSFRAGAHGMIGGQETDLAYAGKSIDRVTLETLHKRKTAALIAAALECGGIIGNSPDLNQLSSIGETLGLAFQIVDDILDGDTDQPTILKVLSVDEARGYARQLFDSAVKEIHKLSRPASKLEQLAHQLVFRTN
jgi:geranylgeranyl diphosphate synthase type II